MKEEVKPGSQRCMDELVCAMVSEKFRAHLPTSLVSGVFLIQDQIF